jgi:hypothetical protein
MTTAKRPTVKISKIDAAKRQLETAIRLWFFSGEPVSIHTLTAAAHQVLHDLARRKGNATILRGLPGVKPAFAKRLRKMKLISGYQNFFKHADTDPLALLDFNPKATEVFILDAVVTYESLTQEVTPILNTFKSWIFLQEPQFMSQADREKLVRRVAELGADFSQIPKAEFFTLWLTALQNLGIR